MALGAVRHVRNGSERNTSPWRLSDGAPGRAPERRKSAQQPVTPSATAPALAYLVLPALPAGVLGITVYDLWYGSMSAGTSA